MALSRETPHFCQGMPTAENKFSNFKVFHCWTPLRYLIHSFAVTDFSLSATLGTHTSLKNLLSWNNHLTPRHQWFLQALVLDPIQSRCLQGSTPNPTHEVSPAHSICQPHQERWGASPAASQLLPLPQPEGRHGLVLPQKTYRWARRMSRPSRFQAKCRTGPWH